MTAPDQPAGVITRILAALIDGVVVAALTGAVFGAVVAGLFVVNPVSLAGRTAWPPRPRS